MAVLLQSSPNEHTPRNIIHGTRAQLILFLVLHIWTSHFGLPVLVAIILFSKRVQRHATFVNLCITFIIIGISSSLLVYARRTTGPEPSRMLCLLQAALLYGMPPMAATAAFMLVLQMFFKIRAAHHGKEHHDRDHMTRLWMMLVAPYITFFVAILTTVVVGANDTERVSRNRRFFYCSMDAPTFTNTVVIVSALFLLGTIIMEVWIIVLLIKHRAAVRMHGSRLRWSIDLSFPFRIAGFGLYIVAALSLCLLSIASPASPVPDLVIASAATVIIIIFGTQLDILRVLCFWRKCEEIMEVQEDFRDIDLKHAFDSDSTYTT